MQEVVYKYKKVIESVRLLCISYEHQKEFFPEYVDAPFEILDTFKNAFLLLPNLIECNSFSNTGIAWLLRLYNLIKTILHNKELKNLKEDQFESNTEWEKVRDFSKEVLLQLREPLRSPDLKYI